MSPIVGTYTNSALNTTLVISNADDSTGSISGTLTVNGAKWNISGVWNTSTMTPNAVFFFWGSNGNPTVVVAGTGASTNFQTFANTNISISFATTGGVVNSISGSFVRS